MGVLLLLWFSIGNACFSGVSRDVAYFCLHHWNRLRLLTGSPEVQKN